jgi:hypothetical protein
MADTDETEATQPPASLDAATIAAIKQLAGQAQPLNKAASDPAKIVASIQQARNDLELAGDMQGASLLTQAIALIQQATGEAEAEPDPEEAALSERADPALAVSAKTGNLKKAGATFSAANLAGMKNTVVTLLGMMAGAGSAEAKAALHALQGESMGGDTTMAAAIGAEFGKAVNPLAAAIINMNDRLTVIEKQPAVGGPVIRSAAKQITGQAPPSEQKPAMSVLVREQLAQLQRLSRTANTPALAKQYDDQYQLIKAQYSSE